MRVCIVGAGSIGGFVAARLARAGETVTVVARGANLAAIQREGIVLEQADGSVVKAPVQAVARLREAGPQDVVILAVKAHQVADIVDDIASVLHDDTVIIPMQNGVPWWYFQRQTSQWEGQAVESVDPGGRLMKTIDPGRIIGCVVYPACELTAPGRIRHVEGERFPVGELDGSRSARVEEISAMFQRGGFKSPVLDSIRDEIWLKLWGNLSFNPISALAHATLADICEFPLSRELAAAMMREAQDIATRLGARFRVSLEKRIEGAGKVGHHKTSMLQDVESGRDPEIDALVGSVIELGRITGIPTPHLQTVYALMKLLGRRISTERIAVRAQAPQQLAKAA
jgi:2-dehydropantoate 2-reductase